VADLLEIHFAGLVGQARHVPVTVIASHLERPTAERRFWHIGFSGYQSIFGRVRIAKAQWTKVTRAKVQELLGIAWGSKAA
jgi:hypothetical protein